METVLRYTKYFSLHCLSLIFTTTLLRKHRKVSIIKIQKKRKEREHGQLCLRFTHIKTDTPSRGFAPRLSISKWHSYNSNLGLPSELSATPH